MDRNYEHLTILHAAAIWSTHFGGPRFSVPRLVEAQAAIEGVDAGLWVSTKAGRFEDSISAPVFNSLEYPDPDELPAPFGEPDIVVFHSTYIPSHVRLGRDLRRRRTPYIVVPRGGLTETAQAWKGLKKKAANALFFDRFIRGAKALHFLTHIEAEASRNWHTRSFVVGNGIAIPERSFAHRRGQEAPLQVVFIGRIDPHIKGLDLLLSALSQLKSQLSATDIRVTLFGPLNADARRLQVQVDESGLADIVSLPGAIEGVEKERVLSNADVFVATSRSEGHPVAVLEALAYGVPCILTPGTNIASEVAGWGAGIEVQPEPDSIATGLLTLVSQKNRLPSMGQQARRLVKERYRWDVVARQTLLHYQDLIEDMECE